MATRALVRRKPVNRWTPLRPHLPQARLWASPARFKAVAAGRRSGKTEVAKRFLARALPVYRGFPDSRYFFGGPTHDQAKHIAWQDLLDLVEESWVPGGKHGPNVSWSELSITCVFPTHTAILFVVGLDKPARVEGVPWDGCVLDESCDLKPGTFKRSVRPALSDRKGWCWRIGVPKRMGPGAAEFREFCEACQTGTYPDSAHFAWPSSDILPPEEIAQARSELDLRDYLEQYEASWQTAGGEIFHAFSRENNCRPVPYHPAKPLVVGCDFNVDPMAWVIGHRYANRLEIFDELWLRNTNTWAALDWLWGKYGSHEGGYEFYGDASSQARKTSTTTTDYLIIANDDRFRNIGRTVHFPMANPNRADRFASCNAMFRNGEEESRLFIDPRCVHLIQDLEMRGYKPGTREPADEGDIGHITDALGYVVHKLFPVRLDVGRVDSTVIIQR